MCAASYVPLQRSGFSYQDLLSKITELTRIILNSDPNDPNLNERELEDFNVKVSKYLDEMEEMAEYKKAVQEEDEKWKKENLPLNRYDFDLRVEVR